MAFSDYKITNFEKPVSALADTPQMSADALKAWFDSNSTGELKTSVNGIIDEAEQLESAVSGKVDKVDGKGLSTNDFTDAEKTKLAGVEPAMQHTHANKAVLDTVTEPLINARGGVEIGSDGTSATEGGAVGRSVHAALGGAIGSFAQSYNGGAVGHGAKTSDGFAGGYYAKAMNANGNVIDAVQLGTGTNSTEKTLQVYGYRMMEANGKIPDARLNDAPADGNPYGRKNGSWTNLTNQLINFVPLGYDGSSDVTDLDNLPNGISIVNYADGPGYGGYMVMTSLDGGGYGQQIKIGTDGMHYRFHNGPDDWSQWSQIG